MVGIEACATAHHWSRELSALGHEVRLMPPAYVKPYVKRHKNDAADAEAICEAVIPHLRDAGGGSIINLSSIYGLVGGPDLPPYYASKGAVRLMTKTDALLYAPDKIRVNSIHPGYIWTPMVENLLRGVGDLETGHKTVDALHPLGHMGEADDIAWGAVYLASDEAKFVTGAELIIDGGYTAR
jgi:NAD(P)-dependent dehydrogenase (short-subunit alcohol dehydrogenase family)